jgi:hypothetical protein
MSEQDASSCSNHTNDVLIKNRSSRKPMNILIKFLRSRKTRREEKYDAEKPVDPGNPLPPGALYKIKQTTKEPKMKPRFKLYAIKRSSSLTYNVPPVEAQRNPSMFFQNEQRPVDPINPRVEFKHAGLFTRNEPAVDHSVPRLDEKQQQQQEHNQQRQGKLFDKRQYTPSESEVKEKLTRIKQTAEERKATTLIEPVEEVDTRRVGRNEKITLVIPNIDQLELETKYAYNDEIKKEIVKTHEFLKVHRNSQLSTSSSESTTGSYKVPSILIIEKPSALTYVQPQRGHNANMPTAKPRVLHIL